eukprot:3980304-Prymnesium_polylepis.1
MMSVVSALLLATAVAVIEPPRLLPRAACHAPRTARAATMGVAQDSERRRPSRVGQVVRAELATIFASGDIRGAKRIPAGLNQMISIVDIDMSPDLRNARVKVSIIGDRKDKISAVRWLQGNSKSIRHEMAQRLKGMKRIPQLSFQHVDVGAAVDMMVKLEQLSAERRRAEAGRGDGDDDEGLDFDAADEDAFAFDDEDDEMLHDDDDDDDDDFVFRADEDDDLA